MSNCSSVKVPDCYTTLALADIQAFAAVSGDTNPAQLNEAYANENLFHGVIAHGMWGGALISPLLGTQFPPKNLLNGE